MIFGMLGRKFGLSITLCTLSKIAEILVPSVSWHEEYRVIRPKPKQHNKEMLTYLGQRSVI